MILDFRQRYQDKSFCLSNSEFLIMHIHIYVACHGDTSVILRPGLHTFAMKCRLESGVRVFKTIMPNLWPSKLTHIHVNPKRKHPVSKLKET